MKRVVADAGTGLERGVKLATEARPAGVKKQEDGAALGIDIELDVLHTQRELQRIVQRS